MSDILNNSLSNYGMYIKERLDQSIIEDHRGFVTYDIEDNVLWIRDVFVQKEFRQQGVTSEWMLLLKKIALDSSCTQVNTHVCIKTNGWEISLKYLVTFGFTVVGQIDSLIYLMYKVG